MKPRTFDERVAACLPKLSAAEQRVARFFQQNRAEALMASAAAIAERTSTSDATVVRTTKSLGFSGLDDLRRLIAAELGSGLSQADRLANTLQNVGDSLQNALTTTLDIHLRALEDLRRDIPAKLFKAAVNHLTGASRVVVFGIGPSSALAIYFAIQLGRFGLEAVSLTHTGLLFADELRKLRKGDVVVMLAYGRVYTELAALIEAAESLGLRKILLTDTLLGLLQDRHDLVLPVARGRTDMLSMHTATMGLIEALLVGVAAQRPHETMASLKSLKAARKKLVGKPMSLPIARKD